MECNTIYVIHDSCVLTWITNSDLPGQAMKVISKLTIIVLSHD